MGKPQISFPELPVIACIPASVAGGRAFINLTDGIIQIGEDTTIQLPVFFISDGMSVPSIADGVIEPTDGIMAGHIHDILYSGQHAATANEIANALDMDDSRAAADEVFCACMEKHAVNFNNAETTAAGLAVRMFGGRYFRKHETDLWRKEVAGKIGGMLVQDLGNGLGKFMDLATVWKLMHEVVTDISYANRPKKKATGNE